MENIFDRKEDGSLRLRSGISNSFISLSPTISQMNSNPYTKILPPTIKG